MKNTIALLACFLIFGGMTALAQEVPDGNEIKELEAYVSATQNNNFTMENERAALNLAAFVMDRIQYPEIAKSNCLEERLEIRVTIGADRQIRNVEFMAAYEPVFEKEVRRVLTAVKPSDLAALGFAPRMTTILMPIQFVLQ